MLSISHMAIGASIANSLPNPLAYVPLVIASHFLLDGIIHWDCGTGLSSGKKSKSQAVKHELVELFLALIFLSLLFWPPHHGPSLHAWLGAFISLVPDLIEAPKNFLSWKLALLEPVNRFHDRFHNSTPDMRLGLTPQLILLFLVYILI